jgi:hypothetical protein
MMDRAGVIRRAEVIAATQHPPGFITRSQLKALLLEANWIKETPDAGIDADIAFVIDELHAKGIVFMKD